MQKSDKKKNARKKDPGRNGQNRHFFPRGGGRGGPSNLKVKKSPELFDYAISRSARASGVSKPPPPMPPVSLTPRSTCSRAACCFQNIPEKKSNLRPAGRPAPGNRRDRRSILTRFTIAYSTSTGSDLVEYAIIFGGFFSFFFRKCKGNLPLI